MSKDHLGLPQKTPVDELAALVIREIDDAMARVHRAEQREVLAVQARTALVDELRTHKQRADEAGRRLDDARKDIYDERIKGVLLAARIDTITNLAQRAAREGIALGDILPRDSDAMRAAGRLADTMQEIAETLSAASAPQIIPAWWAAFERADPKLAATSDDEIRVAVVKARPPGPYVDGDVVTAAVQTRASTMRAVLKVVDECLSMLDGHNWQIVCDLRAKIDAMQAEMVMPKKRAT